MPHAEWPLLGGRPIVQLLLPLTLGSVTRHLLADTGAGDVAAGFELVLDETDCLSSGATPSQSIQLGGAYSGSFPVYTLRVQIPSLSYDHYVRAVGVKAPPQGLDGIACFRFPNRFVYGNFGQPDRFGLEC